MGPPEERVYKHDAGDGGDPAGALTSVRLPQGRHLGAQRLDFRLLLLHRLDEHGNQITLSDRVGIAGARLDYPGTLIIQLSRDTLSI